LGVAQQSIANKAGGPSNAAYNLHQQGSRGSGGAAGPDVIILPD